MTDHDNDHEGRRTTANLAGLAMALLLVVVGLVLARKLAELSKLEDCVMSGRTNCVSIDVPP